MLVGNGVRLNSNPGRALGAPLANVLTRGNWNETGALKNIYTSGASKLDGIPSGMRHPQVWLLPRIAGALASRFEILGDGEATGNLAGGVNADAAIDGAGQISAADLLMLGYLVAAVAGTSDTSMSGYGLGNALSSISGEGVFTGDITSVLNALADLTGFGDVTGDAVATLAAAASLAGSSDLALILAGAIVASASLSGSGVISTAAMNAITQAVVDLTGLGVVTTATLQALGLAVATVPGSATFGSTATAEGSMLASIIVGGGGTELSPEAVAASVKAALLDTTLDGFTIEEIIKLTSAALLGKSSGGATNPVFRSLDDTADRVTGEVDGFGNRTSSTLSP